MIWSIVCNSPFSFCFLEEILRIRFSLKKSLPRSRGAPGCVSHVSRRIPGSFRGPSWRMWPSSGPCSLEEMEFGEFGNQVGYGCQPKNRGILPPKWMVKIRVPNPMNKWDDLGVKKPPIFGNIHIEYTPPKTNMTGWKTQP